MSRKCCQCFSGTEEKRRPSMKPFPLPSLNLGPDPQFHSTDQTEYLSKSCSQFQVGIENQESGGGYFIFISVHVSTALLI